MEKLGGSLGLTSNVVQDRNACRRILRLLGCNIHLQLQLTPYAYAKASQKMGFTLCTSSCKVKHAL